MRTEITILSCRKYATGNSNLESKFLLTKDSLLSSNGVDEVSKAVDDINLHNRPVMVFYSPYFSALQAKFEIETKFSNDVVICEKDFRLAEQNFGTYAKDYSSRRNVLKRDDERLSDKNYDFYTRYPNGESQLDLYTRLSTFVTSKLDKAVKNFTNIIIITHENAAHVLIRYLFDVNVCDLPSYKFFYEDGKYSFEKVG